MTKSKRFTYPESLDLSDKLAYGIGALIMHWASVETLFYGILECLLGRQSTDNGRVVWLSLRTNDARLKMIAQLARVQNLAASDAAEIHSACARFKGISRVRNFFCHSFYQGDGYGGVKSIEHVRLEQADSPIIEEHKPVNKATLNEIAHTINEAAALNLDMWRLLIRLRESLPTAQHLELPQGLGEYLARQGPQPRSDRVG